LGRFLTKTCETEADLQVPTAWRSWSQTHSHICGAAERGCQACPIWNGLMRSRGSVHAGLWRGFAIRDGNLVTGQQNFSGAETARLIIEAMGG
jgi:hypothetical protein